MKFIDVLGLVAGFCTSASLIPQLLTTIKKKKAEDVSAVMFIVMLTGNLLWIYYGFAKSRIADHCYQSFGIILKHSVSCAESKI